MPKDLKHDKQEEDAELLKRINAIKLQIGITHIPASGGTSGDELWPTDTGDPETGLPSFRLAKIRRRRKNEGMA